MANKKTWIFQVQSQVKKHGTRKASWYVGWYDPDGNRRQKSCVSGSRGEKLAEEKADSIHGHLVNGTYESENRKTWEQFWAKYDHRIISEMDAGSREASRQAIAHFVRLMKPNLMERITTDTVAEFIKRRRQEKGRVGKFVSPATINKELRYLRAILRVAGEWEFVDKVPKFRFLKTDD